MILVDTADGNITIAQRPHEHIGFAPAWLLPAGGYATTRSAGKIDFAFRRLPRPHLCAGRISDDGNATPGPLKDARGLADQHRLRCWRRCYRYACGHRLDRNWFKHHRLDRHDWQRCGLLYGHARFGVVGDITFYIGGGGRRNLRQREAQKSQNQERLIRLGSLLHNWMPSGCRTCQEEVRPAPLAPVRLDRTCQESSESVIPLETRCQSHRTNATKFFRFARVYKIDPFLPASPHEKPVLLTLSLLNSARKG